MVSIRSVVDFLDSLGVIFQPCIYESAKPFECSDDFFIIGLGSQLSALMRESSKLSGFVHGGFRHSRKIMRMEASAADRNL